MHNHSELLPNYTCFALHGDANLSNLILDSSNMVQFVDVREPTQLDPLSDLIKVMFSFSFSPILEGWITTIDDPIFEAFNTVKSAFLDTLKSDIAFTSQISQFDPQWEGRLRFYSTLQLLNDAAFVSTSQLLNSTFTKRDALTQRIKLNLAMAQQLFPLN